MWVQKVADVLHGLFSYSQRCSCLCLDEAAGMVDPLFLGSSRLLEHARRIVVCVYAAVFDQQVVALLVQFSYSCLGNFSVELCWRIGCAVTVVIRVS
jgi:hypothetical protein